MRGGVFEVVGDRGFGAVEHPGRFRERKPAAEAVGDSLVNASLIPWDERGEKGTIINQEEKDRSFARVSAIRTAGLYPFFERPISRNP